MRTEYIHDADMRKKSVAFTISIVVLLAAVSGALLVNSVSANPYSHIFPVYSGEVAPSSDTQPPKITILSPEHNSTFNTNSLSVPFKVEVGESKSAESKMIWDVYYKADWLENNIYVYEYLNSTITEYSSVLNLTGIPEGRHSITIRATERGTYYDPPFSQWPMWSLEFNVKSYSFHIVGASAVSFTIDVTPLNVTVLPITSKVLTQHGTVDVSLNFTVNGSASKISYALDGQDNVTIAGNMTLARIPAGLHNITVYIWDDAGNIGCSEPVTFNITEPTSFPTTFVATAFGTSLAVVTSLLVYFKKRKH
jgi:FlaG/FlaF family flagellin (archaellin)